MDEIVPGGVTDKRSIKVCLQLHTLVAYFPNKMKKGSHFKLGQPLSLAVAIGVIVLMVCACGFQDQKPTPQMLATQLSVVSPTSPPTRRPTGVPILSQTPVPVLLSTTGPISTLILSPTISPTIGPTASMTPVFLPYSDLSPITADNLLNIQKVAQWQQAPTITGMTFNPDGSILAAANSGPNESFPIKLWSLKDGSLFSTIGANVNFALSLAYSPDGKTLAGASFPKSILLWDLQSGAALPSPPSESAAISLAFSPDGKTLAYGTAYDAKLYIWNLSESRLIRTINARPHDIKTIEFSPDGKEIMTGGGFNGVEIWNFSNGQLLKHFDITGGCTVIDSAVSDTGYAAFLGKFCPGHEYVLEVRTLSNWQVVLDKVDLTPLSFTFLPSTDILIISTCSDYQDYPELKCINNEILFLNVKTGKVKTKIPDAGEKVAVSPDGKQIAFANWEGKIQIWGVPKP